MSTRENGLILGLNRKVLFFWKFARCKLASMPFVSYAKCPAQFCPGIVIPAKEMYAYKTFDKTSRTWNLQCSVCLHKFEIADIALKTDDFSLEKLRQLYPEARRS